MKKKLLLLLAVLIVVGCASTGLRKDFGVSVQLWSVRDYMKKDFEGTLKKLSDMGMDGVEFAGYYHYSDKPEELKKLLDGLNLKSAATHIKTKDLLPENIEKTIAFHKAIDCKYLIVSHDGRVYKSKEANAEVSKIYNQAVKTLRKHGMKAGYHNHTKEFECGPCVNSTWWDSLAENTDEDFILQQDMGWTWKAGKDPVTFVNKYPNRTISTHLRSTMTDENKAKGFKPFIGENGQDWQRLIRACLENGGTEWFSIEQTDYPEGVTSIQSVERSFNNLHKILKEMNLR
ncbi:MAG: sugar phosphate isomerase/epimerase [Lentisphaeraceae bacterium]|nr:sugar phosphate isomerase/epimerase [Lentisphaeraceae bacterium]